MFEKREGAKSNAKEWERWERWSARLETVASAGAKFHHVIVLDTSATHRTTHPMHQPSLHFTSHHIASHRIASLSSHPPRSSSLAAPPPLLGPMNPPPNPQHAHAPPTPQRRAQTYDNYVLHPGPGQSSHAGESDYADGSGRAATTGRSQSMTYAHRGGLGDPVDKGGRRGRVYICVVCAMLRRCDDAVASTTALVRRSPFPPPSLIPVSMTLPTPTPPTRVLRVLRVAERNQP